MFKELFVSKLYKDEFTNFVLQEIKTKIDANGSKQYKDILKFYELLEEDLFSRKFEMTRFCNTLSEQLEKLIKLSKREVSQSDEEELEEQKKPVVKPKKEKIKDIDEWVEYIITDDGFNQKKPKKKNKNSKKKNNTMPTANVIVETKQDAELESFKKVLNDTAQKAYHVRKLKPTITKDWITSICNSVI